MAVQQFISGMIMAFKYETHTNLPTKYKQLCAAGERMSYMVDIYFEFLVCNVFLVRSRIYRTKQKHYNNNWTQINNIVKLFKIKFIIFMSRFVQVRILTKKTVGTTGFYLA